MLMLKPAWGKPGFVLLLLTARHAGTAKRRRIKHIVLSALTGCALHYVFTELLCSADVLVKFMHVGFMVLAFASSVQDSAKEQRSATSTDMSFPPIRLRMDLKDFSFVDFVNYANGSGPRQM